MTPLLRITCCIATLVTVLLFLVDVRPLAVAAEGGPILVVTSQETGAYKDVLTGFRLYFANRNGALTQRCQGPAGTTNSDGWLPRHPESPARGTGNSYDRQSDSQCG